MFIGAGLSYSELLMGDAMEKTGSLTDVMIVQKVHAPSLEGGALRRFLTSKGVEMSPSAPRVPATRISKAPKEREPKLCRNAWELWTSGRRPGGEHVQRGGTTHADKYAMMTPDEKIAYLQEYANWLLPGVGRAAF